MKRTFTSAILLCFAAILALAADFTGTWKGDFHTREGGTLPVALTLKADGENLTGSMTQGESAAKEIGSGKVNGDQITFVMSYASPTGETRKINYTGKIDGKQLKLTSSREGSTRTQETTLERQ